MSGLVLIDSRLEPHRFEVRAGNGPIYLDDNPSLHAGLVFDRASEMYQLWAFHRIVKWYTRIKIISCALPLFESLREAASEPDPNLRSLKCGTIALPGMEDVGAWRWIESLGNRVRYLVPPTPSIKGPPFACGVTEEVELRQAVVAGWTFAVARADEIKTVFYTQANPTT